MRHLIALLMIAHASAAELSVTSYESIQAALDRKSESDALCSGG